MDLSRSVALNKKSKHRRFPQCFEAITRLGVSYSNSMIEAWWRCLKHTRLYLHSLDSFSAVEKFVACYIEQHNTVMPHRAFDGRTPNEVCFGTNARRGCITGIRMIRAVCNCNAE